MSRWGEACKASTSALPVCAPCKRRKSSAAITTTSSRPCTVTCCGPSLRTRRTSSLKRALASCSNQCPGGGAGRLAGGLVGSVNLVILTRLSSSGRPIKQKVRLRQSAETSVFISFRSECALRGPLQSVMAQAVWPGKPVSAPSLALRSLEGCPDPKPACACSGLRKGRDRRGLRTSRRQE